jgi:tetratricopeptide (TPR) repeat protein
LTIGKARLGVGSLIYIYAIVCGTCFAQLASTTAPIGSPVAAHAPAANSPALAAAEALFAQGKYAEAEAAANKLPDGDKYSVAGNLLRGKLALSANQLSAAQGLFAQALRLDSKNSAAAALLGEVYARQQLWMDAAPLYDHGKRNALALQAQDVAASMPYTPFRVDGLGALDRIPLLHAQIPAVLGVRIGSGEVVNFAVDLNADQLVIDAAYAKQLELKTIGDLDQLLSEAVRPDSVKLDRVTYSTISEFAIGVWTVRDLPVTVRSLARNSAGVNGLIGAGVLRHFLVTLDVGRGQIWLRRPDDASAAAARKQAQASAVKTVPVRFTPAGALVHADGTPLEDALWRQGAVTMDFKDMVLYVGK